MLFALGTMIIAFTAPALEVDARFSDAIKTVTLPPSWRCLLFSGAASFFAQRENQMRRGYEWIFEAPSARNGK